MIEIDPIGPKWTEGKWMDWADQIGPNRLKSTKLDPRGMNGPNGRKWTEYTEWTKVDRNATLM